MRGPNFKSTRHGFGRSPGRCDCAGGAAAGYRRFVESSGRGADRTERSLRTANKFLLSMLDAVTSWEMENGELRLFFHPENRTLSEMLQAKEPMERLRTALHQVLGQQLRVCVKLDSSRGVPAQKSPETVRNCGRDSNRIRSLGPCLKNLVARFQASSARARSNPWK